MFFARSSKSLKLSQRLLLPSAVLAKTRDVCSNILFQLSQFQLPSPWSCLAVPAFAAIGPSLFLLTLRALYKRPLFPAKLAYNRGCMDNDSLALSLMSIASIEVAHASSHARVQKWIRRQLRKARSSSTALPLQRPFVPALGSRLWSGPARFPSGSPQHWAVPCQTPPRRRTGAARASRSSRPRMPLRDTQAVKTHGNAKELLHLPD